MSEAVQTENKMGVMPVKKLIVTMSLPMMISMLVQALYNIVDSIFVSQINENALTAVTLAFPMQMLVISFGGGTGVGINALLSKALGERRFDRADKAANTGIFLTAIHYAGFLLLGLFAAGPFIRSQTQDPEIITYGTSYLSIVLILSFGAFTQILFERLLQSTGKTFQSMITQITGAVINIILDPILIFGLFGMPKLGVSGAGYATIFGQMIAGILAIIFNIRMNKEIHFKLKLIFHPDRWTIGRIYAVGIPSILMMSIGSVMTYLMNRILIVFSTTATAVFGVYFKLQSFFFMPVFGLNNGLIPVLAYNYGAKKRARIQEALRFSVMLAFFIMVAGMTVFFLIPDKLLDLFNASEAMKQIGIPALRTIAIHFPIAGISIALGSTFQAFSKSIYALVISVSRQLVVLIPAAYLLSLTGMLHLVWWSFPIAEVVSLLLSIYFYTRIRKGILEHLEKD